MGRPRRFLPVAELFMSLRALFAVQPGGCASSDKWPYGCVQDGRDRPGPRWD